LSSGDYNISVTVQDWGAGSVLLTQSWFVRVLNINRPPVIDIGEPLDSNPIIKDNEPLKFIITYTDNDLDDIITLRWFLDGIEVASGENTYTYYPTKKSIGKHVVTIAVNDLYSNSTYSWNLTIKKSDVIIDEYLGLSWDQWGIFLEVLVVVVTGFIAFYGVIQYRKRKGILQKYMKEIEGIMKTSEKDPDRAESELIKLSIEIEQDFKKGMIEDFHFFLIDRQIKESMRDVRNRKIEQRFSKLPEKLQRELNHILEDGRVTGKEYQEFIEVLSKSEGISKEEEIRLRNLIGSWRSRDESRRQEEIVPEKKSFLIKERMKKKKPDVKWEDATKDDEEGKSGTEDVEPDSYSESSSGDNTDGLGDVELENDLDDVNDDLDVDDEGVL
jgi:hypothetical protein